MKKSFSILSILFILSLSLPSLSQTNYTMVIEGFDWGPHVNKVILESQKELEKVDSKDFSVSVTRSSLTEDPIPDMFAQFKSGNREVINAFVSDNNGNPISKGNHITLVLAVAPNNYLGSAIQYFPGKGGNKWINYQLDIKQNSSNITWNKETRRIIPILDDFDLTGKFTHKDINLSYASYNPVRKSGKAPLLIWLHGGGEGGTDPSIAAIGNKAVNYASKDIQSIFGGAHVLVPQAPTYWMHSATERMTTGKTNDIYNEALMELIKMYVAKNKDIDTKRIYIGGCSNGGYMSLRLIFNNPDFFAGGYISALAFYSEFASDQQIESIKNVPIWFVQSKDDKVTDPQKTAVPIYHRLKKAGAENVHFTFPDHVVDITNQYGGNSYHYDGHWSWIYLHANEVRFDFDGSPVKVNGMPVTIMQWLAAQSK